MKPFIDKEVIARKQKGLEGQNERVLDLVQSIRYQKTARGLNYCYESLADCHRKQAMFDYFIAGDMRSLKQNLYVASQLEFAALALYDYQRFSTGSEILYALLSDSLAVASQMAQLQPTDYLDARSNPQNHQFVVHMYQLALRGDYEFLRVKVQTLENMRSKKERELPAQGDDFFSLLMRGEKTALENLISQHARVTSKDVLIEDFMCFQGTLEAKICWSRGVEVQVDSSLLPMDLMPIVPLAHYDDVYDFLEPGYVPAKVSWLERVRYRLRERKASKELTRRALGASRSA